MAEPTPAQVQAFQDWLAPAQGRILSGADISVLGDPNIPLNDAKVQTLLADDPDLAAKVAAAEPGIVDDAVQLLVGTAESAAAAGSAVAKDIVDAQLKGVAILSDAAKKSLDNLAAQGSSFAKEVAKTWVESSAKAAMPGFAIAAALVVGYLIYKDWARGPARR